MKKFLNLIILLLSFLFFTCFEQILVINNNLDGQLIYKITYYKDFNNFINFLSEKNIEINTNSFFNKKESIKLINEDQNNSILNYSLTENKFYRICETTISFIDLKTLSKELPINKFPTILYEKNKIIYCSTIISTKFISVNDIKKVYAKLTPDEKTLTDNYITLMKMKFIYKTKNQITSYNKGKISNDRKELIYECTLYDILNTEGDIEISFNFNK